MNTFNCRHNGRFRIQTSFNGDRPPYIWVCASLCGYWLSFNPAEAGSHKGHHFVNEIRIDEWWEKTLVYTIDNQGAKEHIPLVPSRF